MNDRASGVKLLLFHYLVPRVDGTTLCSLFQERGTTFFSKTARSSLIDHSGPRVPTFFQAHFLDSILPSSFSVRAKTHLKVLGFEHTRDGAKSELRIETREMILLLLSIRKRAEDCHI